MNGKIENYLRAQERRRVSGEALPGETEKGAETEAPGRTALQGNHMRSC